MSDGLTAPSDGRPPLAVRAAYAALMVPMRIVWGPLLSVIPALYARHGSIGLKQLGLAMMAMRLLDVVIDPLIGMGSDGTRSRWGRRKPWILAGALIVLPATWLLFAIPRDAGIVYFAICMGSAYLGWSMVEIPHATWLGDLSAEDDARATLAGWRSAAVSAGAILYLSIPLLPRFADAAMTPAVLAVARELILILLPAALLITLLFVPDGGAASGTRPTIRSSLRGLIDSRALRTLCLAILLASIASGMCAACYVFYLDTYLGILSTFAYIGLFTASIELPAGLVWPRLIARIGKRTALAIAYGWRLPTLIAMALISRGPDAAVTVILLFAIAALTAIGGGVAIPIMAAEAADEDERRTGTNKRANFIAATILCAKLGVALGGGAAFVLLDIVGFDPKATNGPQAMSGFDITLFVIPTLLYLTATIVALRCN